MSGWNETAWFSIFAGSALKSTAVLAFAWLSAALLGRRSAAARHLVWTAAAAAVLALPVFSILLPSLPVRTAGVVADSASSIFSAVAVRTIGVAPSGASPAQPSHRQSATASPETFRYRPDWRLWLMLVWAAGSSAALVQMLVACAAIWRVRRSAKPFAVLDIRALTRLLGIRHAVNALESETGSMPMTFGILRATIFLPSDAAGWSEERRRIVLLHELAHVRRGDVATHLLARLALSLYWWNPVAWIAWREFLKERERAADDLVLGAGARASEYAGHLLEVARTMNTAPAIGWAAVAMARRSQLEGRLVAILDERVNRNPPGRAAALTAALLAVGMVAPLAAVRAQDNQSAQTQTMPPDVDVVFRAATSQKNPEILENAAKAAEGAQQLEMALKMLKAAAELRATVSGRDSVAYGMGLMKLADLEWKQNQRKASVDFYTQALQVLGERPEAGPALIRLGIAVFGEKRADLPPGTKPSDAAFDYERAVQYFQHAQTVDPEHAAIPLMWMAIVRQREKNFEEADKLYQRALAVQDSKSADMFVIRRVYSEFLTKQGRVDEAKEFDNATAAMQNGQTKRVAPAGVYKIADGVKPPKLAAKVEPSYSEDARAAMLTGTVVLSVIVGTDGLAHDLQVLRPLGLGLDEKAVEAIEQWKFIPGTKDGQSVQVIATIEVNFRLL